MKSFVALNFIAGFLHYLFLVLASRQLSAGDFSSLSAWLAYISFAFVGAGVLQYLSCFVPLGKKSMRALIGSGLAYAVAVSVLPFCFSFDTSMIGLLAGLLACAFGLFLGQAQARLLFLGMSAGNLAVGAFKLIFALVLPLSPSQSYFWAVPLAYVPATVIMCAILLRKQSAAAVSSLAGGAILATLVLGLGSALFPQFELMLMRATQSAEVFDAFARLSLFYKAIFFVFLIFSQWLLPYQLKEPRRAGRVLADPKLYLGASALAGFAALAGPRLAVLVLGWAEAPSALLIFLSCLNMGLLTWIFLLLQDLAAKKQTVKATVLIAAVFAVAPVQWFFAWPVVYYFACAIAWNSLLLWRTVTSSAVKNPESFSPASAA